MTGVQTCALPISSNVKLITEKRQTERDAQSELRTRATKNLSDTKLAGAQWHKAHAETRYIDQQARRERINNDILDASPELRYGTLANQVGGNLMGTLGWGAKGVHDKVIMPILGDLVDVMESAHGNMKKVDSWIHKHVTKFGRDAVKAANEMKERFFGASRNSARE